MSEQRIFTKDQWFEVCKAIVPGLTWEDYEPLWDDFLHYKAKHQLEDSRNVVVELFPNKFTDL